MRINPNIFKEYDVRGVYPDEINEKSAYEIGRGFADFLNLTQGDKIIVAKDSRKSSPKLADAFSRGIIDAGANIIDIGTVSTPTLYFSIANLKAKGGAMITASHNPKKYNGIKFAGKDARPIGGREIKSATDKLSSNQKSPKQKGSIKKMDIKEKYHNAVYENFSAQDGPASGWNGKKIKIPHSFDYDGDRLIIQNKKREKIRGDIIGGIIGGITAKKSDKIVYDLRCSRAIPEYFRNKGIVAIPSRVGHFNIKKLMREKKAVFGMELTGHYYFKKFNYCESPEFALNKLAEHIVETGEKLSELMQPFNKYYHSGIINIKNKNQSFEKIIAKLQKEYKNGAVNFTDGITVEFSNWWFNLRQSHTEPLIRLSIEANSKKLLTEKQKELIKSIKK